MASVSAASGTRSEQAKTSTTHRLPRARKREQIEKRKSAHVKPSASSSLTTKGRTGGMVPETRDCEQSSVRLDFLR